MIRNIALSLSSGGARGIAHIGVIRELERQGYKITSISGSSIGALIGGFYAAGKLDYYADWVCSLDRMDVFNLMDFNFRSRGFIQGKKVFKRMEEWIQGINIEDLEVPFVAVASDIKNRKEKLFSHGSLLTAIRASVAIPGLLMPARVENNYLFDGGVSNPLPVNRVKRTGNDALVAVDLNAYITDEQTKDGMRKIIIPGPEVSKSDEITRFERLKLRFQDTVLPFKPGKGEKATELSFFATMNGMFDFMQEQITHYVLEETTPDLLIQIPREICSTFEFHKSKKLIELGSYAAKNAIENHKMP